MIFKCICPNLSNDPCCFILNRTLAWCVLGLPCKQLVMWWFWLKKVINNRPSSRMHPFARHRPSTYCFVFIFMLDWLHRASKNTVTDCTACRRMSSRGLFLHSGSFFIFKQRGLVASRMTGMWHSCFKCWIYEAVGTKDVLSFLLQWHSQKLSLHLSSHAINISEWGPQQWCPEIQTHPLWFLGLQKPSMKVKRFGRKAKYCT